MDLKKHEIALWGIVGLVIAVFLFFMSQSKGSGQQINTPYLVPQPLQPNDQVSQTPTISEQPNIIGDHPSNPVPNGSGPSSSGNWVLTPNGNWQSTGANTIFWKFPYSQANPYPIYSGATLMNNPPNQLHALQGTGQ